MMEQGVVKYKCRHTVREHPGDASCICVPGAPSNQSIWHLLKSVGIDLAQDPSLQVVMQIGKEQLCSLLGDHLFPPLRRIVVSYWLGDMTNLLCIWQAIVDGLASRSSTCHNVFTSIDTHIIDSERDDGCISVTELTRKNNEAHQRYTRRQLYQVWATLAYLIYRDANLEHVRCVPYIPRPSTKRERKQTRAEIGVFSSLPLSRREWKNVETKTSPMLQTIHPSPTNPLEDGNGQARAERLRYMSIPWTVEQVNAILSEIDKHGWFSVAEGKCEVVQIYNYFLNKFHSLNYTFHIRVSL